MADTKAKVLRPGSTRNSGDGVEEFLRMMANGALAVVQSVPRFADPSLRGEIFTAVTAVGGVAPGTAIGTTAAFTLFNPKNSGKVLIPIRVSMGYISGTLGAGTIFYCGSAGIATPGGSGLAPLKTRLSAAATAAQGNSGMAYSAATLASNPTILRPFTALGASLASTAVQPWQVSEDLDGEFTIDPEAALSLEAVAAAGSTPLVVIGMSWMELPL